MLGAALGLCCYVRAFSSCSEWGHSPWSAQTSHCSGFSCCQAQAVGVCTDGSTLSHCSRLRNCSRQAFEHRIRSSQGMWNLPGPGVQPVSPALAGRFLSTAAPGKSWALTFLSSQVSPVRGAILELRLYYPLLKIRGVGCQVCGEVRRVRGGI